jgi:hypothetical protein
MNIECWITRSWKFFGVYNKIQGFYGTDILL